MKSLLKSVARAVFLLVALPAAALAGFGRVRSFFSFFAQACSLAPGLPGDYLRAAFYRLTLEKFSHASRISFGSFFAHPEARIGEGVYIGSYCVIGKTHVGERTQIASGVMADVGAGSTIGAGAVVSRAIPAGSTAIGVPARVIERAETAAGEIAST